MLDHSSAWLGLVVSACLIVGFAVAFVRALFRLVRKLDTIATLPETVRDIGDKLQVIVEQNERWHSDHLRLDHGSGKMRRRDS